MVNMEQDRAVLIISYARPSGVRRLLNSCIDARIGIVYISIDGPKDSNIQSLQSTILQVVEDFSDKLCIYVNQLDANYGVGVGVLKAIDWFFQNVEHGVILEDDLQISASFLPFIFGCLEDDSLARKVKMVSGTRVFTSEANGLVASYYPMIWGWGTWKNSWQLMREAIIRPKWLEMKYLFDSEYWYWRIGAERVLNGAIDTWDTPLAFEFYSKKWLCAYPPVNLVSNLGFDEFASHTTSQIFPMGLELSELALQDLDLQQISIDRDFTLKLKTQLYKVQPKHLLLLPWSTLTDFRFFPRKSRKKPLVERLQSH